MNKANYIIVSRSFCADITTPILAYTAIKQHYPYAVLLESLADQEQQGRYSHIGCDVIAEIIVHSNTVVTVLDHAKHTETVESRHMLAHLRQFYQKIRTPADDSRIAIVGGLVGYLNYETIHYFEEIAHTTPDTETATIHLQSFRYGITFDHQTQEMILSARCAANTTTDEIDSKIASLLAHISRAPVLEEMHLPTGNLDTLMQSVSTDCDDETFKRRVDSAKQHIHDGDIFQVVLSRTFSVPFTGDPLHVYRALRYTNPSPYLFYFTYPTASLIGASPEKCVSVRHGMVEVNPLAGTRPRGDNLSEPLLEIELANDSKECAEHMMLVDLARNDLGRVAAPGSVKVKNLLQIKKARHVMHLSSQVQAKLSETADPFDAIQATFPAGTLSGAPKIRAMEIIHALEATPRQQYGGAIILLDGNQQLESCIAIRMTRIENEIATVRTGAGIVFDSDPQKEADETIIKARSILQALQYARGN